MATSRSSLLDGFVLSQFCQKFSEDELGVVTHWMKNHP